MFYMRHKQGAFNQGVLVQQLDMFTTQLSRLFLSERLVALKCD